MVSEVESILVEIREHVRAEEAAKHAARGDNPTSGETLVSQGELAADHPETLARISAHLTTTARAWDRLPAVVSNRTGRTARLELWIKRSLKKFSRWFTWEQINFNSAVHNALVDAVHELSAQRQELSAQRQELASLRDKLSRRESELQTLGSAIDE